MSEYELMHYGVKGMRWGVRRNPSKAYAKASKELDRRKLKAYKTSQIAAKQRIKTNKRLARISLTDFGRDKERRMLKRVGRAETKAYRAEKSAHRFEKHMRKSFADVKVSDISKESLDAGREYVSFLLNE